MLQPRETTYNTTLGYSSRSFWTILLGLGLLVAECIGTLGGPLATANAALKPHVSNIPVSYCNADSDSSGNATTAGTLSYALANYASGDTIQFACSGGTAGAYTITVPSIINVAQNLTLDGNGYNVTLDGGNAVEILNVITATNFTLNGLTIAHGKAPANNCYVSNICGGGIYDSGILTITNSTFYSNTADNGGAIFINTGGNMSSLTNSSFISNAASTTNNGWGGAIYIEGSVSSLSNSTFAYNQAYLGGAIYISYGGSLNSLSNSTFTYNSGTNGGGGGAIVIDSGGSVSSLSNSSFISNSASSGGGAISLGNGGSVNSLSNSTFAYNSASHGGAISIPRASGIISSLSNSTFISNSASAEYGGAISINSGRISSLNNSTFAYNSAPQGGAIANQNAGIIFSLNNSTFAYNSAPQGGAIANGGTTLTTNNIFVKGSSGGNCIGSSINGGGGSLSDDGSCSFSPSSHNNVTNLNLGTLGYYNGGTTQTIPLLAGSAALFAGVPANCPATDQNNQPRPQPAGTRCDSGAFESSLQLSDTISAGSNPNPSKAGQSVVLTATVTGNGVYTPTGSVAFTNTTTNTPLGSSPLDANGNAVITPTFASAGNFNIAVGYSGNLTFTAAITNFTQVVNPASTVVTLTSDPNPSVYGQPLTFTATVSPAAATGTVTFTLGTAKVVATLSGGTASYVTSTLPVGATAVSATYAGNSTYGSSTSNQVTQQVNMANTTTSVTNAPNPANVGQSVTFTATVAAAAPGMGTPSGTVSFTDSINGFLGTGTLSTGTATFSTAALSVGSHIITAISSGDGNFNGSSNTTNQDVGVNASALTLTSNLNPSVYGQSITFTATVNPATATGNVTFTLGTNKVVATLSGGTATYITSTLPVGATAVSATYAGDTNYGSSTSNQVTQQVLTLPPTIAPNAGGGQSTPISSTFPVNLQAIVRDGNTGNPLPGAIVVFQAPTSGASGFFSPTNSTIFTATTDANGFATASALVANATVGSYQITASTAGAASPAVFNLVNNPPVNIASGYTYYLPFLANTANNFTTYLAFQNTANISSTVSISFFDNNGNPVSVASGTCTSVAALGECIVPNPFASSTQGQGIIVSQQPLNVIVSEATPYGGSAYAVTAGASNTLIAPVAIKGGLVDFTTQLSIFNGGNSAVAGTVQFFDQNGNHISAADKSFNLPAHSTASYDQATDNTLANFYGWAEITSPAGSALVAQTLEQRPAVKFVAIVNAQLNPQTTLYAPAIFNGAFGNFVTGANLVNPSSQPVTVTITYYKNDGTASPTAPFTIAPNAVTGIFQGGTSGNGLPSGGLPNGWYGAATVKVTGGSNGIIMFVNEQGGLTATGSDQSGTYGAAVSGSSMVGLPVMANGAFGGYITGATIENITSAAVTASVQYYDVAGNAVGTAKSITIGGNASYGLYQGGSDQALPSGFYGTAQITVTGGPSSSLLVTTNAQSNAFFYSYTEPNF
jgi:hypothetical protein